MFRGSPHLTSDTRGKSVTSLMGNFFLGETSILMNMPQADFFICYNKLYHFFKQCFGSSIQVDSTKILI